MKAFLPPGSLDVSRWLVPSGTAARHLWCAAAIRLRHGQYAEVAGAAGGATYLDPQWRGGATGSDASSVFFVAFLKTFIPHIIVWGSCF